MRTFVHLDTGGMVEALPVKDTDVPPKVERSARELRELMATGVVIFESTFGYEIIPVNRIVRVLVTKEEEEDELAGTG